MIRIHKEANFSAWPISRSLKKLLIHEEKWPDFFSINPEILAIILNVLAEQTEAVDFFLSPTDTRHFFKFLEKLVMSKPRYSDVLNHLSEITVGVLDKISLEPRLNDAQVSVTLSYLELLSLLLEPNYRYLFDTPEIRAWTNDFQKISRIPFNSPELLSKFRSTLLLSFQTRAFIKNYPAVIQTIADLSQSIEKNHTDSNELAAMKLFDTLGELDHSLKIDQLPRGMVLNQTRIKQSIQETRNLLYDQFKPFVEESFLQYIVYKSFLQQSYKGVTASNLTELCQSGDYRAQCNADYRRFKDSYSCPPGQFADFSMLIQHNNLSGLSLNRLCAPMRTAESFVPWMEGFGFLAKYNDSRYVFRLYPSQIDFRIDKFLLERDDSVEKSYTVLATYFQDEKRSQTDYLLGRTYSHTTIPAHIVHEYIHHLYALFVDDLEFDLTTTEGIAELHATGVCPVNNIHNLRNFVNDTFIFEFLKARKYPFYFNALKWVAYLVNEEPTLFKTLIELLQIEEKQAFYANIDSFIENSSNIEAFVAWSNQQITICNHYLTLYPDAHEPPLIYLDSIKSLLGLLEPNSTFNAPIRIAKRSLPIENLETKEMTKEFIKGMPLPVWSLMSGFFAAGLDDVGLANKASCPSLPAYINYGLRPLMFAAVSAGLNNYLFDETVAVEEQFAHFFSYWMMNTLSVILGQSLAEKIAEKIHNKLLGFFVQSLTWTMLWNPSLFMTENNKLLPVFFLQLLQGVFFKAGEVSYQLTKNFCTSSSSFWHKKEQLLDIEDAFLNNDEELQVSKIAIGQPGRR